MHTKYPYPLFFCSQCECWGRRILQKTTLTLVLPPFPLMTTYVASKVRRKLRRSLGVWFQTLAGGSQAERLACRVPLQHSLQQFRTIYYDPLTECSTFLLLQISALPCFYDVVWSIGGAATLSVNQLVVRSIPTAGANEIQLYPVAAFETERYFS